MKRIVLCLIALALASTSFGIGHAQEPSPTGTPVTSPTPVSLCVGQIQSGGQPLDVTSTISVTPPGGANVVIAAAPPALNGFSVCYVQGNARVIISRADCREISRENPTQNNAANLVLDSIVNSCRIEALTATPTQMPQVTPTPLPTTTVITPPDTGTAGLK
jgi:hypothetical protein